MRRLLSAALAVLALPPAADAQATRYDVGQRLVLFEKALEKHPSAAARQRAVATLNKVTPTFFSGRLGDVAALLDRSRHHLLSEKEPAADVRWAESLVFRPARRLVDSETTEVAVQVASLYKTDAKQPDGAQVRLTMHANSGGARTAPRTVAVGQLPFEVKLPVDLKGADYRLRAEVLVGGKPLAAWEQTVSLAPRLKGRLAKLRQAKADVEGKPASVEKATLGQLTTLLSQLAAGQASAETDYPAARLLAEAEALAEAAKAGKAYHGPDRPGQFWLTLPTGEPVRVQVPEKLAKGKPVPLVVALHGAGGSENLFFDGYGNGLAARLARDRGWLLVATRSPLLAFGGPDLPRVVDALAKIYPVDTKNVMLVGHSMGAGQAVAAAGRRPERYAAVAALGGGGGFKASAGVAAVPVFVGVGAQDFALAGARRLHGALKDAGVKTVVYKVYDDVEHVTIVQLALPEVFAFFDRAVRR